MPFDSLQVGSLEFLTGLLREEERVIADSTKVNSKALVTRSWVEVVLVSLI